VSDDAYVTYRIAFSSLDAVTRAMEQLLRAGFSVTKETDGPHVVLEAGMAGDEGHIDDALDQALAGIDHEPEISWNAARFTGFTQPSP
jgi:hypothetical protein